MTTASAEAGNSIWWGGVDTTTKIPVTARRAPAHGDQLCINGASSGSDCGVAVADTNGVWVYEDGDALVYGDRAYSGSAADCSKNGDSGGSVVFNHVGAETEATAEGIISGHANDGNGGCYQYFTGPEEAIQAWGGEIKMQQ